MIILYSGTEKSGDYYIIPLPFKSEHQTMPNNYPLALKRLMCLRKRFLSNKKFHNDYLAFLDDMIFKGFVSRVTTHYPEGRNWYVPHHGVYHPTKKKIRFFHDCAATFQNTSLNKQLLQGFDLISQLIGILI